ncbi:hypothetical protein BH11PLA2_BH11PLA2_45250 [soil metagenome]
MFQHVALWEAAFENNPELIRELASEGSPLTLLHFRSKAEIQCIDAGLLDIDYMDDDEAMDAEYELFRAVAIHHRKRAGYTAHVVAMPPPEFSPEAHFVAIVHKDDEPHEYMQESHSTRYFTLEKTDISDQPLLCEWLRDGTRENYGERTCPRVGGVHGCGMGLRAYPLAGRAELSHIRGFKSNVWRRPHHRRDLAASVAGFAAATTPSAHDYWKSDRQHLPRSKRIQRSWHNRCNWPRHGSWRSHLHVGT